MKPWILAAIILLIGCTGTEAPAPSATPNDSSGQAAAHAQQEPLGINTANLSFDRKADDVLSGNITPQERERLDFSPVVTDDGKLIVYYFFSSGCEACKALQPEIETLQGRYQSVEWRKYDLAVQNGSWAYLDFAGQYNLSMQQRLVPQVLVNNSIITDRFNINRTLEGILAAFSAS